MSDTDTAAKPVEAVGAEVAGAAAAPDASPSNAATDVQEAESAQAGKTSASAENQVLKTTAKTDYRNHANNRKFDPSSREVTDDPNAILKQVEFYFGDWNFPQDKFMWESCGGSENKPILVKTIHSFKRMRSFQPYTAVVAALRDSNLLEVSGEEGEEVVKRKVPYKPMPSSKARFEAATVYVKGFGDETPGTQFDLESFFANFGEVKGLKLRRTNQNLFKGSVFVTFADEESAKKFINMDPAPKWKDHELKIMSKHDYCEEKSELIRQGKLEPNSSAPRRFYEGKDSSAKDRGRGPRDRDDWKKRREHDQKQGFSDRRGGGRGGGRGRGRGRARGRGGREGRRDDRRGGQDKDEGSHGVNDVEPHIQSSAEGPGDDQPTTTSKRSREDEADALEAPAAKKEKVEAKKTAAAEV